MPRIFNAFKTDESLMLAYQNGDVHAFEVVYRRHKDALFTFLLRAVRRMPVAEDLAQDIWFSVIHTIASYRPRAAFKTYLYHIARNRLVDHWRREARRASELFELFDEEARRAVAPMADNPEIRMQVNELLSAIAGLPQEQAEVLLLHEEGFSRQEIAAITEARPETVKSRLRYAKKALQRLEEDDESRTVPT